MTSFMLCPSCKGDTFSRKNIDIVKINFDNDGLKDELIDSISYSYIYLNCYNEIEIDELVKGGES